jgi:negative regulator of sigma E activity
VEVDGHPLIDFKVFSELADQVDAIVQYTAPPIENVTRQDVLAYVEWSLKSSPSGENLQTSMNDLSAKRAQEESRMLETRERLRSLGLPWSPPRRK